MILYMLKYSVKYSVKNSANSICIVKEGQIVHDCEIFHIISVCDCIEALCGVPHWATILVCPPSMASRHVVYFCRFISWCSSPLYKSI